MRYAYFGWFALWGAILLSCQAGPLNGSVSNDALKAALIELDTRPGVKQKFIFIQPPQPVASVILFAGGHGNLRLSGARSMGWGKSNFLVRTRWLFAKRGLMVAVVDAPSDRNTSAGMRGFRTRREHVADIEAVMVFLREKADLPVWLVGTSRGTLSAAHIANHSNARMDGLVLTSSMAKITTSSLANIRIPTLVVAHNDDGCRATPPNAAKEIINRLINAPKAEVLYFDGGWPPESGPCKALSRHGFYGIEKKVVEAITDFIK